MADELISREVAIEKTEAFCDVFETNWTDEKVLAWIKHLPTVDAVVLPCKVGDTVWMITSKRDNYNDEDYLAIIQAPFRLDFMPRFGKTVFLTREEAEKALEGR